MLETGTEVMEEADQVLYVQERRNQYNSTIYLVADLISDLSRIVDKNQFPFFRPIMMVCFAWNKIGVRIGFLCAIAAINKSNGLADGQ